MGRFMANEWKEEELRAIAAARGGKLRKVTGGTGKKGTLFLFIECSYGHLFSKPLKSILHGGWCPICEKREKDLWKRKEQQHLYEVNCAYALSILAYEYPQWFHLGPPYLPPMHGMHNYLMEHLQEKYPELTEEMIQSAIRYVKLQPDYYTCLVQPGPRYLPDGTVDAGKPITPDKAASYREKYLHPSYQVNYVLVYTDGGCQMDTDPWSGTWAYTIYDINSMRMLARDSGNIHLIDRKAKAETVALAELTAAIMALHWCNVHQALKIQIRSDSMYVVTPSAKPPGKKKNYAPSRDLVDACALYYSEVQRLGKRLLLQKVKGHSKLWENELVDAMCRRRYRQKYRRGRVVLQELAAKRRKPWLARQMRGMKIQAYRKAGRGWMARLRRWSTKLGYRLIAFGKQPPKNGRKKK